MKNKIIQKLKELDDGVSFAELARIEGFKGEYRYGYPELNMYLWFSCSAEAVDALIALKEEGQIKIEATHYSVYLADRLMPKYPVAEEAKYSADVRWLPAVLYKGEKFELL